MSDNDTATNTEDDAVKAAEAEAKAAAEAATAAENAAKLAARAEAKAKRDAEKAEKKAVKEAEKANKKVEAEAVKAAKEEEKAAKKAEAEAKKAVNVMPEQNGVRRPKPETLCGKAWTVMDDVSKAAGRPAAISEVLPLTTEAQLNEGNVKAEYARWRKFNGVTGRVLAPKPAATEPPAPAAQFVALQLLNYSTASKEDFGPLFICGGKPAMRPLTPGVM